MPHAVKLWTDPGQKPLDACFKDGAYRVKIGWSVQEEEGAPFEENATVDAEWLNSFLVAWNAVREGDPLALPRIAGVRPDDDGLWVVFAAFEDENGTNHPFDYLQNAGETGCLSHQEVEGINRICKGVSSHLRVRKQTVRLLKNTPVTLSV